MENIKKAIKHFECMKSDAVAVLDSGFGTKPNESNTVYKNRKLYAELAINALEKQIPKKPYMDNENGVYEKEHCPTCHRSLFPNDHHCRCGQALDWSDTE